MSRREEWREQVKLKELLDKWLDPDCSFATATDPVSPSALTGFIRKKRGVVAGFPDWFIVDRGRSIFIEMKSRTGRLSVSQRETRAALLRAGVRWWWVVRSARAGMVALAQSQVRFRTIDRGNGEVERWQRPRGLPSREQPRRDVRPRRAKAQRALLEAAE
jgi:hypothetical protein